MATFEWNGRAVSFDDTGRPDDPAPLVFVHGWTADRRRWDDQVAALSPERRCVRLDLPGHGLSAGPVDFTVESLARCVVALLDDLGIERFTVVGHSMGGMAGMVLALAHPERVVALVLVDSIGRMVYSRWRRLLIRASLLLPFRAFVTINIRRAFSSSFPRARIAPVVSAALENDRRVVYGYFRAMTDFDVLGSLGGLRAPTLVVHGDRDVQFPLRAGVALARAIPDSVLRIVHAGHESPLEVPDEITVSIRRFLAGVAATPREPGR